jgi:Cys-tRNA(Pro)/Cys-tRNA(Cys) deacylase
VSGKGTPAVTAVRRAGVAFRTHEYEHDPGAGSYGLEAAERLGVEAGRVFKTLIARVDEAALVVGIVPVARQLDLKALAAAAGGKKAAMADPAEAERASGYVVGAISPLGQRKRLRTVIDESASRYESVFCSGGRRGLEIELSPGDLARLTGATLTPIAR